MPEIATQSQHASVAMRGRRIPEENVTSWGAMAANGTSFGPAMFFGLCPSFAQWHFPRPYSRSFQGVWNSCHPDPQRVWQGRPQTWSMPLCKDVCPCPTDQKTLLVTTRCGSSVVERVCVAPQGLIGTMASLAQAQALETRVTDLVTRVDGVILSACYLGTTRCLPVWMPPWRPLMRRFKGCKDGSLQWKQLFMD